MEKRFQNLLVTLVIGCLLSFAIKVNGQAEVKKSDTLKEGLTAIGFYHLFMSERGNSNAKFTVVFESGAGGGSQDWTKVIALLPPGIRTVAYDRAGTGKSEKGPVPQT